MANAGTVEIDFAAETAKFTAELKKVRADLKLMQTDVSEISKSLSGFGTALKASIAGTAVIAGFRAIVKATAESEAATAQLEAALKSASTTVRLSSEQFQAFAKQMQNTTTFTDEAVLGVQSILLAFRSLSGQTILSATSAVLDLSTRLGTDLTSAARLVGRALEDPEKGLSGLTRAGIVFSRSQQEVIKNLVAMGQRAKAQEIILNELQKRFGGAAEAARNTLGGALTSLQNTVGDLFEGDKSSFSSATKSINDLSAALSRPDLKEGFNNLIASAAKSLELMARLAIAVDSFGGVIAKLFVPVGSELSAVQALEQQLRIREQLLVRHRVSGLFQDEELQKEAQYIETLKQRIVIAKQLEEIASRRAAAQALEPVSVTVSPIEGREDDTLTKLKREQELLEIRQKAITASIATAGNFLEGLDRQLGDGKRTLTELNEEARKLQQQSREDFAEQLINASVAEFDRRLRLEQQLTEETAKEQRKRVLLEQAAAAERVKVGQDAAIKSVAILGFLVSGHKSANKAIELANKIATIRQIVIDTKGAVMATLKYFGGTPWGWAAAAAVAAFGALQIRGVLAAETTFSIPAAANFNSTPVNTAVANSAESAPVSRTVIQVQVNGVMTPESAIHVADALKDVIDNADVRIISPRSAQAQDLRI
jgi:hypothetical protein